MPTQNFPNGFQFLGLGSLCDLLHLPNCPIFKICFWKPVLSVKTCSPLAGSEVNRSQAVCGWQKIQELHCLYWVPLTLACTQRFWRDWEGWKDKLLAVHVHWWLPALDNTTSEPSRSSLLGKYGCTLLLYATMYISDKKNLQVFSLNGNVVNFAMTKTWTNEPWIQSLLKKNQRNIAPYFSWE